MLTRHRRDPTPLPPGSTGLFHVAWLHPIRAALADSVRRVVGAALAVRRRLRPRRLRGAVPERPRRPRDRALRRPPARAVGAARRRARREDGHAAARPRGPARAGARRADAGDVPADTLVGHVHLKVADVPRATAFYRDALGFEEQAQLPSAAFLAAGGYHHHVGLNSWQSRGAASRPRQRAGPAPGRVRAERRRSAGRARAHARRRRPTPRPVPSASAARARSRRRAVGARPRRAAADVHARSPEAGRARARSSLAPRR